MELKYKLLNMDLIIKEYEKLLTDFCDADEAKQIKIIEEINKIRDNYLSMCNLSYFNYLLDVNSDYWNEQEDFFTKNNPIINNLKLRYYDLLNKSKNKDKIKKIIGSKVFEIAKAEVCLLSDDTNIDVEREKELSNEYEKLIISAKVYFDDKELSLTQLEKYLLSSDRTIRFEASKVKCDFMKNIGNKIDNILDELIKTRTSIAKKLGFNSYTDQSYIIMKRLDYDKQDISSFRNEVLKYLVPFVQKMKEQQREELGLEKLMYYDDSILFKDGNASLKGDTKWVLEQAAKMYKNISPKLYKLFKKMTDEKLMDLDNRKGKSGGGFTTYIPDYKVPVFISNFNGTSRDIQVLTHEFGHSFQLYSSKNLKYYENWWPTFDACEIHSTTMELLTLPYMNMFFKDDDKKYIHEELFSILNDICSICLVDEFQHTIYDEYELSI